MPKPYFSQSACLSSLSQNYRPLPFRDKSPRERINPPTGGQQTKTFAFSTVFYYNDFLLLYNTTVGKNDRIDKKQIVGDIKRKTNLTLHDL